MKAALLGGIARRLTGSLLELGIKAYGTAAAVSVALSDAETVGGKLYDGIAAVPNLMERYRQAKYVFDHREQIQAALDYVHQHAPDARQVEAAVQKCYQALDGLRTMLAAVSQARDALARILSSPADILALSWQAFEHLGRAWEAVPDLDSIAHLADVAQKATPLLKQLGGLEIDFSSLYGGLLCAVDNFARDEIVGTLGLMGAALATSFALALAAGFWGRRGRPGFIVRTLQGWGARCFPGWYVRNLEAALGRPLYAAARARIQGDIVADPAKALDPDAYRALQRYFEHKPGEHIPPRP